MIFHDQGVFNLILTCSKKPQQTRARDRVSEGGGEFEHRLEKFLSIQVLNFDSTNVSEQHCLLEQRQIRLKKAIHGIFFVISKRVQDDYFSKESLGLWLASTYLKSTLIGSCKYMTSFNQLQCLM